MKIITSIILYRWLSPAAAVKKSLPFYRTGCQTFYNVFLSHTVDNQHREHIIMEIPVLDHIIIGDGIYVSLCERGLI